MAADLLIGSAFCSVTCSIAEQEIEVQDCEETNSPLHLYLTSNTQQWLHIANIGLSVHVLCECAYNIRMCI